ncbi:LOW QUALITY PROTEIN: cytochrome P450 2C23-like [Gastrophryne carolinensis]
MAVNIVTTLLLTSVVTLLIYLIKWWKNIKKKDLPPGPTPLPLLGNILQISTNEMPQSLVKLGETYGPVYTVYMTNLQTVVFMVTKFNTTKNLMWIIMSKGERWKIMRRFSLMTRDFGMGRRSLEERIQEEACCLGERLLKSKGKQRVPPISVPYTRPALLCGAPKSSEGFLVINLVRSSHRNSAAHSEIPSSHYLYIKRLLIPQASSIHFPEENNPNTEFHNDNLFRTVNDLFFAGAETTSTTLRYGFLILLKYPEIQERIHKEIDNVIGRDRRPSMEVRTKMPYTDAVIHEIQRFADIIAGGVIRSASKDTTFRGYHIPKGTMVFPVLTSSRMILCSSCVPSPDNLKA